MKQTHFKYKKDTFDGSRAEKKQSFSLNWEIFVLKRIPQDWKAREWHFRKDFINYVHEKLCLNLFTTMCEQLAIKSAPFRRELD